MQCAVWVWVSVLVSSPVAHVSCVSVRGTACAMRACPCSGVLVDEEERGAGVDERSV